MEPLITSVLDIFSEFQKRDIPLIVGGGLGLFLKKAHMERKGAQTLFSELPEARATNDIDLFLRTEVLANLERTQSVVDGIRALGFLPVEEAKFLQWKRPIQVGTTSQEIKIDVLVGPLGIHRAKLRVTGPRARPKGNIQFHTHPVEEAIGLEEQPTQVELEGKNSSGTDVRGTILVPEAFPFLLMKLHAYGDRREDANKNLGRHHALDAYTITGLMTENEYDRARILGTRKREESPVTRVREIIERDFSSPTALGVLRVREHPLARPDLRINDFISVLREIFTS